MILIVAFIFLVFVMGTALIMLMVNKNAHGVRKEKAITINSQEKEQVEKVRNICEIMGISEFVDGIIVLETGRCIGLARLEGTNFSVLSNSETDVKELVLIDIQNNIKLPSKYITSTVITDTGAVAKVVRSLIPESKTKQLANYRELYSNELDEMKFYRKAMAQVSWMVIASDYSEEDPIKQVREKMENLQEIFRARAGIIYTPLWSNEKVIDSIHQILLPEKLTRPSEIINQGGLSPIKISIRELEGFMMPGA